RGGGPSRGRRTRSTAARRTGRNNAELHGCPCRTGDTAFDATPPAVAGGAIAKAAGGGPPVAWLIVGRNATARGLEATVRPRYDGTAHRARASQRRNVCDTASPPTMTADERYRRAVAAFDEANAGDPNRESIAGEPRPRELVYAERLTAMLARFAPDASEPLRLAAR